MSAQGLDGITGTALDVEPDVQDVTVLNLVGLSFEALEAGPGGLRV
jgi:hypothetical protein